MGVGPDEPMDRPELRLEVNAKKSGTGRPWERKFLGFRVSATGKIEVAPTSLERFKEQVRGVVEQPPESDELEELRRPLVRLCPGLVGILPLAEQRNPVFRLEQWIRRHIRACFWDRWHDRRGRLRHLRALGIRGRGLKMAHSSLGAWRASLAPSIQAALSNATLRKYKFLLPQSLRRLCRPPPRSTAGGEQTARPVVWEGVEAQSSTPDPISDVQQLPHARNHPKFLDAATLWIFRLALKHEWLLRCALLLQRCVLLPGLSSHRRKHCLLPGSHPGGPS